MTELLVLEMDDETAELYQRFIEGFVYEIVPKDKHAEGVRYINNIIIAIGVKEAMEGITSVMDILTSAKGDKNIDDAIEEMKKKFIRRLKE